MELPQRQDFMGVPCGHCGTNNTVVEVYSETVEGLCMSCARPVPVPKEVARRYRGKVVA